jgi:hypothetical protein
MKRLYFECYRGSFEQGGVFRYRDFDLSRFVICLLLFDELIISSMQLQELHSLLGALGANGLILLLEAKAVRFKTYTSTVGESGQAGGPPTRHRLPLGSYCFEIVETRELNNLDFERERIRGILNSHALTQQQRAKISDLVLANILGLDGLGTPVKRAIEQLSKDVSTRAPEIRSAVAMALSRRVNRPVSSFDFSLELQTIEADQYRAESNIGEKFGLDVKGTHDVVASGLLAVAGLNEGIARMEQYDCLTVFRDDEYDLFGTKLTSLYRRLSPDSDVERFKRLLSITGLPDFDHQPRSKVDARRLLKIRRSSECKEFRDWLPNVDSETDEEIADRFRSINSRLAVLAHGRPGRAIRWAAITGAGSLGPSGLIAGLIGDTAISFLDKFVFEKILTRRGPESFLSRDYPSIFRRP